MVDDDWLDRWWRFPRLSGESGEQHYLRAKRERPAQLDRVIDALVERYQIPRTDAGWRLLALAVIVHYVPAMQWDPRDGPGRPPGPADLRLFERVARLVAADRPEREACSIVCKGNKVAADRLRAAYRRWDKIVR